MNTADGQSPFKYPWVKPYLDQADRDIVSEALASGWISDGEYVRRFEKAFAETLRAGHALSTCNGSAALLVALRGLDIGPGDEVIVPGYGFAGAANMVLAVGATPIFADVGGDDWCLDPSQAELLITPQTKAMIVIHNYGAVAHMDMILSLANRYNLKVIEDCAEALFSEYQGMPAGTIGDVGCFSFHAAKTITTGEGGMVVTQDEDLYERMRLLRNYGKAKERRYFHELAGYNLRLSNILAALGWAQIQKKEFYCRRRQLISETYRHCLSKYTSLKFQEIKTSEHPVYWINALLLPEDGELSRDEVIEHLTLAGIETRPGFETFDRMPPYKAHPLPLARRLADHIICLPTYVALERKDVEFISYELKRCVVKEKSFF